MTLIEVVALGETEGQSAEETAGSLSRLQGVEVDADWVRAVRSSDGYRTVLARMGGSCGER
jgi:hypothetical protein